MPAPFSGPNRNRQWQLPTELAAEASSVPICKNICFFDVFAIQYRTGLSRQFSRKLPGSCRQLPGRYLPLPAAVRPAKGAGIETLNFDCLPTL